MAITEQGPSNPVINPDYQQVDVNALYGGQPPVEASAPPVVNPAEGAVPGADIAAVVPQVMNGESAPVVSATEYGPPAPKQRASVRLADRIGSIANKIGNNMAERRTTQEVGRAALRSTGKVVVTAAKESKAFVGDISSGAKELGKTVSTETGRAKDDIKSYMSKKATEAKVRKETRTTARADKKDERASEKAEFKDMRAAARTDRHEKRVTAMDARIKRQNQARVDRQVRKVERAELWQKRRQTAKKIGKVTLLAGAGIAALPVLPVAATAYGTYKAGKKGAELTGKARDAASVKGKAVKQNYHVNRAASHTNRAAVHHARHTASVQRAATHSSRASGTEQLKLKI